MSDRAKLGGEIVICPPSALQDLWSRKFPDPLAFASGWMRVRARARQSGRRVAACHFRSCRLERAHRDHPDRDAGKFSVTHGEADALVHWARGSGLAAHRCTSSAMAMRMRKCRPAAKRPQRVNRFAELLDRLGLRALPQSPSCALMMDYFRTDADPERGYALAA